MILNTNIPSKRGWSEITKSQFRECNNQWFRRPTGPGGTRRFRGGSGREGKGGEGETGEGKKRSEGGRVGREISGDIDSINLRRGEGVLN